MYMAKPENKNDDRLYLKFHNKIFGIEDAPLGEDPGREFFVYPDTGSYYIYPGHPKSVFTNLYDRQCVLDYVIKLGLPESFGEKRPACFLGDVRRVNVLPLLTKGDDRFTGKVERMSDHNFVHVEFEILE